MVRDADYVVVTRVIDGDTVELADGSHVRYLGVDTPETVHPDKPVECYGPEATQANRKLVEGKRVRLARDTTDADKYGRLLRFVYVDGVDVSATLIEGGFGYVYSVLPDVKHLEAYARLEQNARDHARGLWAACPQNEQATPTPGQALRYLPLDSPWREWA